MYDVAHICKHVNMHVHMHTIVIECAYIYASMHVYMPVCILYVWSLIYVRLHMHVI